MSFLRLRLAYASFVMPILDMPVDEYDAPRKNIYNEASQKSLGDILKREMEKEMAGESRVIFDFINTDWEKRKRCCFTEVSVFFPMPSISNGMLLLDGLFTVFGAFTLKAIAAGHAKKNADGTWKITVTRVEVFIDDTFNFAENDEGPWGLGFWSCRQKKGAVMERKDGSYVFLRNKDFRDYAENITKKKDCPTFSVLSLPHPVESFKEFSYDYK